MRNIYEIFESMKEYQIEYSYNMLQESMNNMDILFEATDDEKKSKEGVIQRAIKFIKDIIKRFREWIDKIIKKNIEDTRDIEELLTSYDFGRISSILQREHNKVTVKCHKHKPVSVLELSLTYFPNEVINTTNSWIFIDEYKTRDGNTDEILKSIDVKSFEEIRPMLLNEIGLTDKFIKEFKLSEILYDMSPIQQLNNLPGINKKLEDVKKRVEDMSNKTIKRIENSGVEVETRLKYFKFGIKVLNEIISVFTAGLIKIRQINESIVRKMISEYNKLPKYKR